MEDFSKESYGLPVFISSSTASTMTPGTLISSTSPTTSERRESILSPKRISQAIEATPKRISQALDPKRVSQALDYAVTSWETFCKQATNLLVEEIAPEGVESQRHSDLESGGYYSRDRFLNDGRELREAREFESLLD
jgi:hypothetical protein